MKGNELSEVTLRAKKVTELFREYNACIQLTDFTNQDNIDDLGRDFKIMLANLGISDPNIDIIFKAIKIELNKIANKNVECLQEVLIKKKEVDN